MPRRAPPHNHAPVRTDPPKTERQQRERCRGNTLRCKDLCRVRREGYSWRRRRLPRPLRQLGWGGGRGGMPGACEQEARDCFGTIIEQRRRDRLTKSKADGGSHASRGKPAKRTARILRKLRMYLADEDHPEERRVLASRVLVANEQSRKVHHDGRDRHRRSSAVLGAYCSAVPRESNLLAIKR